MEIELSQFSQFEHRLGNDYYKKNILKAIRSLVFQNMHNEKYKQNYF